MMSGGGGSAQEAAPLPAGQPAYDQQPGQQPQACQYELKQFLECAQNQSDISLCYGFNEALKQCKMSSGELSAIICFCFLQMEMEM